MLVLMGPGVIGLAAVQINLFVNSILATGEGTGAVSALSYAFRLMYMPIGIFGVSIATAVMPTLSRHAAQNDTAGMRDTVSNGLRLMLMLNVPATVGLIVLATPIVALIFEHGRFTPADTAATAAALAFYAPGLVGYSAVKIAVPSFYSLRDSRTPVIVSAATVLLNVVLNLTLVRVMGFKGLALGTAVSSIFNASVLLWLLRFAARRPRRTPRGGLVRADRRWRRSSWVSRPGPRMRPSPRGCPPAASGHGLACRVEHRRSPSSSSMGRRGCCTRRSSTRPGRCWSPASGRRGGRRRCRTSSGLNPTVYRLASAHFVSDAYSNLYAPLLPALIPRLGLSLTAAGTMAMLFQLAASVSQLGFGHLADRWRPRALMVVGPLVSVVGPEPDRGGLDAGGAGARSWSPAAWAARRFTRPPRQWFTGSAGAAEDWPWRSTSPADRSGTPWRRCCSRHTSSGSASHGRRCSPSPASPCWPRCWSACRAIRPFGTAAGAAVSGPSGRTPGRSFLLYLIVVLRTVTSLSLATFVPVLLTSQRLVGEHGGRAVSIYLFAAGVGGFTGGPLADRFGPGA